VQQREINEIIYMNGMREWKVKKLKYIKKISPVTGPEWPRGFQEVKVLRFHDNGTGWW
jgi:hypothetical protein